MSDQLDEDVEGRGGACIQFFKPLPRVEKILKEVLFGSLLT